MEGGSGKREKVLEASNVTTDGLELAVERSASLGPAPIASHVPVARGSKPVGPVVDPVEVRIFARFPPPPGKIWEAPGYANAVRTRLKELAKVVNAEQAKFDAAKGARDAALLSMAERGVVAAKYLPRIARAPYAAAMEHIAAKSKELESLGAALATDLAAKRDQTVALDARLETATKELEEAHREERKLGPSPKATDPQTTKCRERVASAEHAVAVLRSERETLEKAVKAIRATSSPDAERVRREYEEACREFARYVVDDTMNFGPEFDAARENLTTLEKAFAAEEKAHAVRVAALSAFDAPAVARGTMVVVGAAAAVLLLVVIVAIVVL